ncbi:hypothetical protein [Natrinema halophilum]|uniref:hypothetical protein n=1 Tax=Natrinema halophilum TaxID=1699371 RepID=UPI001F31296B|nr:hypothetical protein [Natrinema halophilum]UHQ96415.1 hypothetical protein HYG82_23530 [Natrinema halophilum]
MSEDVKYVVGKAPAPSLSNAEVRVRIAEIVGWDYQVRLDSRDSTSDHAVYFRAGDLVAILNWLRFRTDENPEPVQHRRSKDELVDELGDRCEFYARSTRLERVELSAVLDRVTTVNEGDPQ